MIDRVQAELWAREAAADEMADRKLRAVSQLVLDTIEQARSMQDELTRLRASDAWHKLTSVGVRILMRDNALLRKRFLSAGDAKPKERE